jgi:hypothetical protein
MAGAVLRAMCNATPPTARNALWSVARRTADGGCCGDQTR